jgi:hypothetical protein
MKTSIISTLEANAVVEEIKAVKKQLANLKKQEEKLKQKLYNYMGEHDVMVNFETGEEFVNWAYSDGYMKFDAKKFAADKPKIYDKYCTMTEPVRTLRLAK